MSATIAPVCGALSCTADGEVVIDHPDHGERVVCADHIDSHEVVGNV